MRYIATACVDQCGGHHSCAALVYFIFFFFNSSFSFRQYLDLKSRFRKILHLFLSMTHVYCSRSLCVGRIICRYIFIPTPLPNPMLQVYNREREIGREGKSSSSARASHFSLTCRASVLSWFFAARWGSFFFFFFL